MEIRGAVAALRSQKAGDGGGIRPYGLPEASMMRMLPRLALPLAAALLSGCLTQIAPKENSGSLRIRWRDDYESARGRRWNWGAPCWS